MTLTDIEKEFLKEHKIYIEQKNFDKLFLDAIRINIEPKNLFAFFYSQGVNPLKYVSEIDWTIIPDDTETLVVPGNIKLVCDFSFDNCTNLQSIIFEDGVECIGEQIINSQTHPDVKLPSTLKEINELSFYNEIQEMSIDYPGFIEQFQKSVTIEDYICWMGVPDYCQSINCKDGTVQLADYPGEEEGD